MNCQEIRSLLSKYLEDDLDPDVKNLVEQHLGSCSGCAKELDALRRVISSLGKLEKVEPPFDFLESIHQRFEGPSIARVILRRIFYPPHIKLPIEAVAVVAVTLLVIRIASFISPGEVMVAMRPAIEEERIEVAMREERLPVIDYEAPGETIAFKELFISKVKAEVKPGVGIARLVAGAQLPTITKEVAVQLANQFVLEQGYTDAKAGLSEDRLYFDEFEQGQQSIGISNALILEARHGSIEQVPVTTYGDETSWNVVYRVKKTPELGQVVDVDKNTAKIRMIPKKVSLDYLMER